MIPVRCSVDFPNGPGSYRVAQILNVAQAVPTHT